MKKFVTMLLAVALIMSVTTVAFAESKGTIAIIMPPHDNPFFKAEADGAFAQAPFDIRHDLFHLVRIGALGGPLRTIRRGLVDRVRVETEPPRIKSVHRRNPGPDVPD